MRRLGKFTGKVYDENYDFSNCPECCVLITEAQANDEQFVSEHHLTDLMDCISCRGCPAAQ